MKKCFKPFLTLIFSSTTSLAFATAGVGIINNSNENLVLVGNDSHGVTFTLSPATNIPAHSSAIIPMFMVPGWSSSWSPINDGVDLFYSVGNATLRVSAFNSSGSGYVIASFNPAAPGAMPVFSAATNGCNITNGPRYPSVQCPNLGINSTSESPTITIADGN